MPYDGIPGAALGRCEVCPDVVMRMDMKVIHSGGFVGYTREKRKGCIPGSILGIFRILPAEEDSYWRMNGRFVMGCNERGGIGWGRRFGH